MRLSGTARPCPCSHAADCPMPLTSARQACLLLYCRSEGDCTGLTSWSVQDEQQAKP